MRVGLYILKRLAQAVPVVLAIVAVNFILLKLIPGDLADVIAGEGGSATPEYVAMLKQQFGLDQPDYVQFYRYLVSMLSLNLGYSFRYNMSVLTLIWDRLPATLLLLLTSIGIALALGVVAGVTASRKRGGIVDQGVTLFSSLIFAMPTFWVGLLAIVLFSVHLRWLPVGGMTTTGAIHPGPFALLGDIARHLVLPATTLALSYVALYARMTRSAMLEVQDLDYVRTARAKGVPQRLVVFRHALRNAILPIVTLTGLQLGSILGGSIVIETVYSWPGLGRLAFEAVGARDVNLLLGLFFFSSVLVILMNLVVDLVYAALDPRIELEG
ncbi:ABC transporter permease [Bosea sp. BH3]|uniref:ABC transporter permease n=1 Tax=Bosea sp. BH3 TaxID=2871701 RepID=UPI0021CAFAB7|nr:ABC transporter permease [Bosea sp. BH3]MCU4181837.1 ABC transporter permease [Bosea sp. BH3]